MENFILTISLLAIGMLLKRVQIFPKNTSQTLNLFVIYVSLPALVLMKVPELKFSQEVLIVAIVPWILLIFSAGIIIIAAKIFNWSRDILAALLLIVPLGNTSFLGIPMVQSFFGEQAVPYALIYDQLGSFLALAVYGSLILALFSQEKNKVTIKSVLMKIITFPPFISLIFALMFSYITLPQSYFDFLSPLAATLVPVVMIAVGFQLNLKLESGQLQPFIIGLSVKMLIAPALIFLLFLLFGLDGMIYRVTVFEAAMPPMISAGALAIMVNLAPKLTAAMIAYGIVFSFVTLPILFYILNII
ncbi:MAG: AEC family transporter [Alcanivoracaceae bacterium]|nr:AEC family transporter [Alcanivoracaceae bacterium]